MLYKFIIDLNPVPKQSFRIGKNKFTAKRVVDYEKNIRAIIKSQLPAKYQLLLGPILMQITYYYPATKKQQSIVNKLSKQGWLHNTNEYIFCKTTRPDVTDNLNKGILDAMNNLVFKDDAQIFSFSARKVQTETDKPYIVVFIRGDIEDCLSISNNKAVYSDDYPSWYDTDNLEQLN